MSICTLPQSTQSVPLVHVQKLCPNINKHTYVPKLYLYMMSVHEVCTSTVPVHTKYHMKNATKTSYDKIFEFRKQSVKRHQHLV